ncbi:LamG domain-containing protein [Candidatus Woesearchaeota archaeon]|nr:LamG domain-containing protein [Candidatus Woesearchaeota archaeon]
MKKKAMWVVLTVGFVLFSMLIMAASPLITQISLTSTNPITNDTNQNISAVIVTSDSDSDPVKVIYSWYKNSNTLTSLIMPFEGGSTTTFTKDYSSYRNNGSVINATWNSTGGFDGFGAYRFDGNNDSITILDATSLDLSVFTLTSWVNPTDKGYIISKWKDDIANESYYLSYGVADIIPNENAYNATDGWTKRKNGSCGFDSSYIFSNSSSFFGAEPSSFNVLEQSDMYSSAVCRYGFFHEVAVPNPVPATFNLSFYYRAASSTSLSTVTNANVAIYSSDWSIPIIDWELCSGGSSCGNKNYSINITGNISSYAGQNVNVWFYITDAWATDYNQQIWIDDVTFIAPYNFVLALRNDSNNNQTVLVTNSSYLPNAWYFLSATYNGSYAALYVNGTKIVNSTYSSGVTASSTPVTIADRMQSSPKYFFNGVLDDFSIYNRVLSDSQIYALFTNQTNVITSAETETGELWHVVATATDNSSEGDTNTSSTMLIGGSSAVPEWNDYALVLILLVSICGYFLRVQKDM